MCTPADNQIIMAIERGVNLVEYDAGGGSGEGTRIELPDGSCVSFEWYYDYSVITWPTRFSAREFFGAVTPAIDHSFENSAVFTNSGTIQMSEEELMNVAGELNSKVSLVRADNPVTKTSIGWQLSPYGKGASEGGYVASWIKADVIQRLLLSTGTETVSACMDQILAILDT